MHTTLGVRPVYNLLKDAVGKDAMEEGAVEKDAVEQNAVEEDTLWRKTLWRRTLLAIIIASTFGQVFSHFLANRSMIALGESQIGSMLRL